MYATQRNSSAKEPNKKAKKVCGRYLFFPDSMGKRNAEGGERCSGHFKERLKDQPLVTIITVCLNSALTIEKCIQSVLHQTYFSIEYIIIDGGSNDGTLDIINKYEQYIDYYLSEPDTGLYNAMNKGVSLAQGDLLLVLNSDDWYSLDCVEKLVNAKSYSGRDIVSSLAQYVDENGKPLQVLRSMPYDESIRLRMPLRHETMLIPSSIYDKVGVYNEEYAIIADFEYAIRLFEIGCTVYELQKPLLFFRNSGLSNTQKDTLFSERCQLMKKQFPFLDNEDAKLFSNLGLLEPAAIERVINKYRKKPKFVKSSTKYIQDRSAYGWRNYTFNLPKPEKEIKSPKISVILPFFNSEATIKRCIESVLSQSFNDFELLCLNDASPDNTQKIIEKYQKEDTRILLFLNDKNLGLGSTRNVGIMHARGDYVFHIDPDDTIPPHALRILYAYAEKYGSEMVKGAYIREQAILGKSSGKSSVHRLCKDKLPIINTNLEKTPFMLNTTEGHWSYLYKTDFIKKVPYPTDLKMGQDSIFLVGAILHAKKITVIDDIVYHYSMNTSSAMNTFTYRKYFDGLEWRRRAWHLLNDAGMNKIGDQLLQSYWGDDFFKSMARTLSGFEVERIFNKYRSILRETGIQAYNNKTSPFLKKLFRLLLDDKDDEAYRMLEKGPFEQQHSLSISIRKDIAPVVHWNNSEKTALDSIHTYNLKKEFTSNAYPFLRDNDSFSLKVLTLCTMDSGGAGTGTQRRIRALRNFGIDARLISLVVKSNCKYVGRVEPAIPYSISKKQTNVWDLVREDTISRATKTPGYCAKELFSLTDSILDMRQLKPLIDRCDIVHLHWVVGMLDYKHMPEILSDKPVAWTLADMNAFTGGCHYASGCMRFTEDCRKCPQLGGKSDLAHEQWLIKKRAYENLAIDIIVPSIWLAKLAAKSSLLNNKKIHVIHNAFPVDRLRPIYRAEARKQLKLPLHKKLILFGADSLTNYRKGGDLLVQAIRHFVSHYDAKNVEIVTFGSGKLDAPIPVHTLGYVSGDELLSLAYSAADIYLFPSREDNAPLTIGESLLCGTPVVSFPVGYVPELVVHRSTGYIAKYLDISDFARGIKWAIDVTGSKSNTGKGCRQTAGKFHGPNTSAKKHKNLYEGMIASKRVQIAEKEVPCIHILLTSLNSAEVIEKTMCSIIDQKGRFSINLHAQDRGSTDGTIDILKQWDGMLHVQNRLSKCGHIRFSWSSEDCNDFYESILFGFTQMSIQPNDFMTWIEAGDIFLPDGLAVITDITSENSEVGWIGGKAFSIDHKGNCIDSNTEPIPTNLIKLGLCDGIKNHWSKLKQPGIFFQKRLWFTSKHSLFGVRFAGDWALWKEMARHAEYHQYEKGIAASFLSTNESSITKLSEF